MNRLSSPRKELYISSFIWRALKLVNIPIANNTFAIVITSIKIHILVPTPKHQEIANSNSTFVLISSSTIQLAIIRGPDQ